MKPINFEEATHILGVAQGYAPLAVLRTDEGGVVINNSFWQLEPEEIELLKHGHMIHIGVMGGQPPMLVAVSNRPIEPIPYPTNGIAFGKAEKVTRVLITPDEAKKILEGTSDAPSGIIPKAEIIKQQTKCVVCDGTGQWLMPGDGHKSAGMVPCRHCNGGYIDAAN